MFANHPYLARSIVKDLSSDVDRNAQLAVVVRDARRARRGRLRRQAAEVVHRIGSLRIRRVRRVGRTAV